MLVCRQLNAEGKGEALNYVLCRSQSYSNRRKPHFAGAVNPMLRQYKKSPAARLEQQGMHNPSEVLV
jgi:hypothetical protein